MQICIATDLSPSFERNIDRALLWAKAHEATLVLLHVVHDPELAPALANDVPDELRKAKATLQQVASRASVPCRVDVRAADDIATEIVAASKQAAYLFVGSQGKSAFARLRLGSIAAAVIRRCHVPVVCCPHVDDEA